MIHVKYEKILRWGTSYVTSYHPWGMNISNNQTSTDYYFITDFRGWVWGLTDDSGTIVESYNYDPFGRILAGSLLSHARFLSGAHEGQWDAEVGLYYLGARYYDPSLGRFIQEDAVEGSADLPASQNRYIYCQNDPVALIDPTGYSPENTGTPARFNLSNLGNFGGSSSGASSTACILPDTSQYFARGDGIWWGDNSPGQGSIYCFDASGDYGVENVEDVSSTMTDKEKNDYTARYKVTINGETVYVWETKDGSLVAVVGEEFGISPANATDAQIAIVKGLNAAFDKITKEGLWGEIGDRSTFLQGIASFAQQNLGKFAQITKGNDSTVYYQFMKHATIGAVIAGKMQKYSYGVGSTDYSDPRYNQYDMHFGFWVSYWADRSGIEMNYMSNLVFDENGDLNEDKSTFGLIDLANVTKAISYQEKSLYASDTSINKHGYAGLMMVLYGGKVFCETDDYYCPWGKGFNFSRTGDAFFDPFNNIGLGTGHLYGALVRKSKYPYKSETARYSPSIIHWRQALDFYGSGKFYGEIILDELVYNGIAWKRRGDKIHDQPLLP